ncbi:predicted protein [Chaetoceros tenuissimus]|uniref:Uncharacterized protein n=1 Tax=Chaetoceros tenuissimus TaxID=426638 RepID=A0AAD3CQC2_9STRA|nr:predicted protein [Chaetoceros tenuissimus]
MEHPLEDSPDFCKRYLKLIMSLPQCMPKDSEEFKKWYKNRFGSEYSDSPLFALRAKLEDHKKELLEQQGQSPKESSKAVSAPNAQAMRPIPGYQYYQNPPVAGFPNYPPQFHLQYSGFPHCSPQFHPQYSGFPHHSQAFHSMPYHTIQYAPLPAQQLTDQQRLPISAKGLKDEQEISQQYGKPLDTFFHKHGSLFYECCDKGKQVHLFRDPTNEKFNGVTFNKNIKKYIAKICINGTQITLGQFALASDASLYTSMY